MLDKFHVGDNGQELLPHQGSRGDVIGIGGNVNFGFVTTIFLPQRRSPGVVGRKLNGNGIVLRAKYFLPGVGIATKIICNWGGRKIVEKHVGQQLTWAIQHPGGKMTIEEAEEIVMTVEAGFGDHYNITKGLYATALLILLSSEIEHEEEVVDAPEVVEYARNHYKDSPEENDHRKLPVL